MEYYSTFMHGFRLGKREQENYVRVPLKKKMKNLFMMWRWNFGYVWTRIQNL